MDSRHSPVKGSRKKTSRLPLQNRLDSLNIDNQDGSDRLSVPHSDTKKSTSDPEIGSTKHWAIAHEGFPPGVTVDELKQYSRRRQPNHLRPQDNIHLEEGSLKAYKSEYKRRFQAYTSSDSRQQSSRFERKKQGDVQLDGEQGGNTYRGEYKDSYRDFPRHRPVLKRPQHNLYPDTNVPMEMTTEKNSQYIRWIKAERAKLLRRSTALKPEGDMLTETEVRREYREWLSPERAVLIRRPPSLKLEGNFENLTSEQNAKYIAYLINQRPVLEKRHTLLKMEGDFDFLTEKKMSFVPHDHVERPHMRKRSTSLKLDGEVQFYPEYKNSFVDFPRERPVTYKPSGNLRSEGELEKQTETKTQYIGFDHVSVPESVRRDCNLHVEGQMEINPEYKENFVDFPRKRPFVRRPENHLKPEGEFEITTEKTDQYKDFVHAGKQRSEILRRPTNLKLEGDFEFFTEKKEKFKEPDFSYRSEPVEREGNLKLEGEIDLTTEKLEKFVPASVDRDNVHRRPTNLKLEGEFFPIPEYRRSYVDFPRERPTIRKPQEQLKPSSERIQKNTEISSMYVPHKVETPRRRTPKGNLKPEGEIEAKPEYNAKYLDFPRRRPTAKRPRENLTNVGEFERTTEKSSQYVSYGNVPREALARRPENLKLEGVMEKEPEYRSRFVEYPLSRDRKNKPCDNLQLFQSEDALKHVQKTYPAFQVLDVKGQKDINDNIVVDPKISSEMDKSSSSETSSAAHHPSYRLEVYNVDEKNQGFHRNNQRAFPNEAIVTHAAKPEHEKRIAAMEAARKRAEGFEKTVKSPEVPKYLTEENNNVILDNQLDRKTSTKNSPVLDENLNDRSFVVLDNGVYRDEFLQPDFTSLRDEKFGAADTNENVGADPRQWVPPPWMDNYTAA